MDIIIKTKKRKIYLTPYIWFIILSPILIPFFLLFLFAIVVTILSSLIVLVELVFTGHTSFFEIVQSSKGIVWAYFAVIFDVLVAIATIIFIIYFLYMFLNWLVLKVKICNN